MSIQFNGTNSIWGASADPYTVTTLSNSGANTLTVQQTINGIVLRTGGGAQTDTTPTATQIVGALPGVQVAPNASTTNPTFRLVVINGSGGTHTLGLGTGVTGASGVTTTATTATGSSHVFMFTVTGTNPAAVSVVSLGSATS